MTKRHVALILNFFLLLALLLSSCTGLPIPILSTPTPALPTPTSFQQSLPPALVETDPPQGSVLGHQSPITFYFNEPVNKSSAQSALTGLPAGAFTWKDEATLVFTPTQPYPPNAPLNFSIASSLQSVNGLKRAGDRKIQGSIGWIRLRGSKDKRRFILPRKCSS